MEKVEYLHICILIFITIIFFIDILYILIVFDIIPDHFTNFIETNIITNSSNSSSDIIFIPYVPTYP